MRHFFPGNQSVETLNKVVEHLQSRFGISHVIEKVSKIAALFFREIEGCQNMIEKIELTSENFHVFEKVSKIP